MAYPSYYVPERRRATVVDLGNSVGNFARGIRQGQQEQEATDASLDYARQLYNAAVSEQAQAGQPAAASTPNSALQQYGLPDQKTLLGLMKNPQTRGQAQQLIQQARAKYEEANDPLKKLQLQKAQYDVQHMGDGPVDTTSRDANTRFKLGREQGLTGEALKVFTLTGKLPSEGVEQYVERGTTPQWYQKSDGTYGFGTIGKDGSFLPAQTPEGVTMLDPRSLAGEKAGGAITGKTEAERDLQAPIAEASRARLDGQTDNVIGTIDKALGQANWGTTGLIGGLSGGVAGTGAYDLRQTVQTIKANLGFSELQAMRDASPTGGALGQVAIQELDALQSTLASLDPNQSEGQLRENLAKVKVLLERQKEYRRQANEAKYGEGEQGAPANNSGDGWTVIGVE